MHSNSTYEQTCKYTCRYIHMYVYIHIYIYLHINVFTQHSQSVIEIRESTVKWQCKSYIEKHIHTYIHA